MATQGTASVERADRISTFGFGAGLLIAFGIASTAAAQIGPAQRPEVTTNRPVAVAEAPTLESIYKACAEVEPDASYLIPRSFSGRTEASGSGAYAYKASPGCPYWVVDFLLNRYSHTWVDEHGVLKKENVLFSGGAFDLPSSSVAGGSLPIVEEDCKRLVVEVLMYRKDPNESTFKFIKSGTGKFSHWNESTKTCGLTGLPQNHSERAPNANMLKIRIAVRVKLRGSWQQAVGRAGTAPPN